ncbi:MAG: ABC transporter substrate-binding protein [Desulfarculaceae bacterium]|nr:ABC transporter substrate-binding protein [Desulfarculaceae bacterium]
MSKKILAALLATLLSLSLLGSASAKELQKVLVSEAVRGFFFVPLYVADGKGFFKEQGLDMEIVSAQGGPLAMQALLAGQVKFCATGHGQVANMWTKGKSTKIVNQMQDKCTFYMIGRPEITGIAQLKGKNVGCTKIGAETFAVGRYLAAKAGLDPVKGITMVGVGGMGPMASALVNDRIQATMAWQPLVTKLLAEKKARMLARLNTARDSEKYFGSPDYSFSVLQVTDETIKNQPELVQKFVNAMVAAERWIAKASPDELTKVVTPYFQGMNPATIKASLEMDKEAFSKNGLVSEKGHQTAVKVFTEAKVITKPVPFQAIVDNSFSRQAQ